MDKIKNTPDGADWFGYSYDDSSNVTQRLNYFSNVAQVYTPDPLNRVSRIDLKLGTAAPFAFESYGYDAMNRQTTVNRETGKQDRFGYNGAGELISAKYDLINGANPSRTVTYGLDNAGDRNNVTDAGGSKVYTPNNLNQYTAVGGAAVTNGSEHELAAYQGISYQYLGDTRLSSINGAAYQLGYDALGRCVKRTHNGGTIWYVYDGEQPILEYNSAGARVGYNVYGQGVDEILMRGDYVIVPAGQGYFYQQDQNGSVTHLTSFQGSVIEEYSYDAFGAPTTTYTQGNFNNRFKFTGREYQSNFGIYEYRARAYHPGLGRFMSEDPLGFKGGDFNLFRYVGNDPVNRRDASGLGDRVGVMRRIWVVSTPIEPLSNFAGSSTIFGSGPGPRGGGGGGGGGGGNDSTSDATKAPEPNKKDPCAGAPKAPPGEDINKYINDAINLSRVANVASALGVPGANLTIPAALTTYYAPRIGSRDYATHVGRQYGLYASFSYGATARAMGLPSYVIQNAAGLVQLATGKAGAGILVFKAPFSDSTKGNAAVQQGIDYVDGDCYH